MCKKITPAKITQLERVPEDQREMQCTVVASLVALEDCLYDLLLGTAVREDFELLVPERVREN